MSTSLTVNGQTYAFPTTGETGWGTVLNSWATAVSTSTLQKTGGTFTLSAEAYFGATWGLRSQYFKSASSNAAFTGVVRLSNTDKVSFRNFANGADLPLGVSTSNRLQFNSVDVPTISSSDTLTNKTLTAPVITSSASVSPAMVIFTANATAAATTSAFLRPGGFYSGAADTSEYKLAVPFSCTVTSMYVNQAVGATGGTTTYTVRKNGVDSTITCTINAATTTGNDTAHSSVLAAGDLLSVKVVANTGVSVVATFPIVTLKITQA